MSKLWIFSDSKDSKNFLNLLAVHDIYSMSLSIYFNTWHINTLFNFSKFSKSSLVEIFYIWSWKKMLEICLNTHMKNKIATLLPCTSIYSTVNIQVVSLDYRKWSYIQINRITNFKIRINNNSTLYECTIFSLGDGILAVYRWQILSCDTLSHSCQAFCVAWARCGQALSFWNCIWPSYCRNSSRMGWNNVLNVNASVQHLICMHQIQAYVIYSTWHNVVKG